MKLRSFRLRLALASSLLAGLTLIGFGLTSWWLIYEAKVSRLDVVLKSQLIRAARPSPYRDWRFYESLLPRALGTGVETPSAILVISSQGDILYQSPRWPVELDLQSIGFPQLSVTLPSFIEASNHFPRRRLPEPYVTTRHTLTDSWRVGVMMFPHRQVAIAINLEVVDQEMIAIRHIFLISIPILLTVTAGGAWWLSGNALRPIKQLTTAIQQVTVKGLQQRVPSGTTDIEFRELIEVFNQMLERLERSFKQASRFSGDAAHELKTPLTIIQGELEYALQQAESGSQVQQSLGSVLDEVHRLSAIVRKLLLLSLADAGQMSLHLVSVNISELLQEMTEDIELLAPHLEVETEISTELWIQGDRDLLIQVLQNLISNAIKYNLTQGWIKVQAYRNASTVFVTISNSSEDIPNHERERIFERFYRVDPARQRTVEGTGLGLSLAREIAQFHGGNLVLNTTPASQTAFTLTLPAGEITRV